MESILVSGVVMPLSKGHASGRREEVTAGLVDNGEAAMVKCSKWQLRQAVGELVHKEVRMGLREGGK